MTGSTYDIGYSRLIFVLLIGMLLAGVLVISATGFAKTSIIMMASVTLLGVAILKPEWATMFAIIGFAHYNSFRYQTPVGYLWLSNLTGAIFLASFFVQLCSGRIKSFYLPHYGAWLIAYLALNTAAHIYRFNVGDFKIFLRVIFDYTVILCLVLSLRSPQDWRRAIIIFGFSGILHGLTTLDPGASGFDRIEGLSQNANLFARNCGAAAIVLMCFIQWNKTVRLKWILYLAILLLISGIVFSQSRGMILAFSLTVLVYLERWSSRIIAIAVMAAGVFLVSSSASIFDSSSSFEAERLKANAEARIRFEDSSPQVRLNLMKQSLRLAANNPIFGVGNRRLKELQYLDERRVFFRTTPHNFFLVRAVDSGPPAALCLIIFVFLGIFRIRKLLTWFNLQPASFRAEYGKRHGFMLKTGYLLSVFIIACGMTDDIRTPGDLFLLCIAPALLSQMTLTSLKAEKKRYEERLSATAPVVARTAAL